MEPNLSTDFTLPAWLPGAVRLYLDHTEEGLSLRELARREGVAASTVMRQVRRYEARRDDPLVDEALVALARVQGGGSATFPDPGKKDIPAMTAPIRHAPFIQDENRIRAEGLRVLRRMAEPGAMLAIAPDMPRAVVLREAAGGEMTQTAVVDRATAQAFALKEWIAIRQRQGRLTTYAIAATGRAELRRMIEEEDRRRMQRHAAVGFAEAGATFAAPAPVYAPTAEGIGELRRARCAVSETPVAVLARRRDKDGEVFLHAGLVRASERLREDFELMQVEGQGPANWSGFIAECCRGDAATGQVAGTARARVAAAVRDLGPELAELAVRVCCRLEGLELSERRMGWSARSGKVVLRIALQRLRRHYDETCGRAGPMIG